MEFSLQTPNYQSNWARSEVGEVNLKFKEAISGPSVNLKKQRRIKTITKQTAEPQAYQPKPWP